MAIQDDIKKAKQQQEIPVYVVSDSDVNEVYVPAAQT